MNAGMFVISHHGDENPYSYDYYSSHGEFKGVQDAICYRDMAGARKFFTRAAAQAYINTEMPENAGAVHTVVEMGRLALILNCPEDYAKLLQWERNRRIAKVTFRINPEDSVGVNIVQFYDNLAAIWRLDPSTVCYDCTKIHISKNIQDNIFAVLDAEASDPCYTGMMWACKGPKTSHELPDDTVELLDGFFTTREDQLLPFGMAANLAETA